MRTYDDSISEYLRPYNCVQVQSLADRKVQQNDLLAIRSNASEARKSWAEFQLLSLNIRMILSIAMGYKNKGMEIIDLMQVGQIAFCHAMDSFKPEMGFMLITYATSGIHRAMQRAIAGETDDDKPLRLPVYRCSQVSKVKRAMGDLAKAGRKADDPAAILELIHQRKEKTSKKMQLRDVEACLKLICEKPVKLDAKANKDQQSCAIVELTPGTVAHPDDNLQAKELCQLYRRRLERIREGVATLQAEGKKMARYAEIFSQYYGLNGQPSRTLEAVGEQTNMSREAVRQNCAKVIRALFRLTGLGTDAIVETLEAVSEQGLLRYAA
ncbi:MAG: sigma-70 family RNA polymerase sigma factor [Patescibacteria group bacterium]|jgi:RNA polymerase sigma factor (sigma-70 family)